MSKSKRRVVVTGPASRLPRGRGEVAATVEQADPVRPRQIRRDQQIIAGPRVTITSGQKAVR